MGAAIGPSVFYEPQTPDSDEPFSERLLPIRFPIARIGKRVIS
jgi:hypothetical protein